MDSRQTRAARRARLAANPVPKTSLGSNGLPEPPPVPKFDHAAYERDQAYHKALQQAPFHRMPSLAETGTSSRPLGMPDSFSTLQMPRIRNVCANPIDVQLLIESGTKALLQRPVVRAISTGQHRSEGIGEQLDYITKWMDGLYKQQQQQTSASIKHESSQLIVKLDELHDLLGKTGAFTLLQQVLQHQSNDSYMHSLDAFRFVVTEVASSLR